MIDELKSERNITENFINKLYNMAREVPDEELLGQAKKCLIDYLGVVFAGATTQKMRIESYLDSYNHENGQAIVFGIGRYTNPLNAAFLNAMNAHTVELDDGHRYGMLHLGAPIMSALFAAASLGKIHAKDFMKGIIVGYEAAVLLARAIQPNHKLRGYHATGTCGTIGAAMGIAAAYGYTKDQMKSTLAAAVTSAAGLLEVIDDGSELKPYNVGRASMDGFMSASMGQLAYTPPEDILGGKRGFFAVLSDKCDISYIIEPRSPKAEIMNIYMKPYAACRHCHPAIEAAINLMKKHKIECSNIKLIKVKTYKLAVAGHDHKKILGINSAKMSIPYSVAAALYYGKAGMREFEVDCINNDQVLNLVDLVIVEEDKELTAMCPDKRAAAVEITLKDNQLLSDCVYYPKGEPENPMSYEEVVEKTLSLLEYSGIDRVKAKTYIDFIRDNRLDLLYRNDISR